MFEGLYDRLSRLKGRSMHERNLQTGSRPLLSGVLHFNHNGREPADALILVGWCLKQLLAEKPKWPSCLHFTAKRMRDFCMTPSILGQTYMNAPSSQCGSTPTNAKLRKSRCGPSHWTKWRSYRPWSKLSYCGFTLYVPNPLHPKKVGQGQIFYYIQELLVPSLMIVMKLENKLHIPHGTETFLSNKVSNMDTIEQIRLWLIWLTGFFKLEEDDILFLHATTASPTGIDDVAVCWVTGGYIQDSPQREVFWDDLQLYPNCGWQDETHQCSRHMPWRQERQNHQCTHKTKWKVVGWYCLRKKWLCKPCETRDEVLRCQELIQSSNEDHGTLC